MNTLSEHRQPLIRQCVICGKSFEASGSQSTCQGPHFKKCVICGQEFEYKHLSDKKQCCSRKCSAELRKQKIVSEERICKYCGNKFTSTSNTAKYCAGPHFKKCIVCGKDFEVDLTSGLGIQDLPKTCSSQCTYQYIAEQRAAHPELVRAAVEKGKQTCLQRYGVPVASQRPEARKIASEKCLASMEQRKQTNLKKYGFEWPSQNPEIKKRISQAISKSK